MRSWVIAWVALVAGQNLQAAGEAPPTPAPASPSTANLGARIDCLHDFNLDKGAAQPCFVLSGLRYTYEQTLSPKLRARLRLDPFGSVNTSKAELPLPLREELPETRDTDFVLIDDYALIWSPRPNLEVAAASYGGAAHIPSVSGLSLASAFADTGWKQTALTATYNLPAFTDMHVRFAAGNGEGESSRNLDPQQYIGFEIDAAIIKGIRANLGLSFDGNSIGSEEYQFLAKRYQEDCKLPLVSTPSKLGYSTQRIGAGLMVDGNLKGAEGLKVGLGWQRSEASDLDKSHPSVPTISELEASQCPQVDVDTLFVEDQTGESVSTVRRTTVGFNANYRLFDAYFVGVDYATRSIDTGSIAAFKVCTGFTDTTCTAPADGGENRLVQTAFTVGGGVDLDTGLTLTLEYNRTDYDKTYTKVFYYDRDGKTSDSRELFNARFSYNWR